MKKRGIFLTIMIGLRILAYLLIFLCPFILLVLESFIDKESKAIVSETTSEIQKNLATLPSWYLGFSFLALVGELIIIVGVLKWKKWAVYLSICLTALSIILSFILKTGLGLKDIIIPALWFLAIYKEWKKFE